jgi:LAO/AO transport system kinase
MGTEDRWRRELSRELTRRARTPAREAMSASISFGSKTRRIGITGPPGAGKSSLIAMLAKEWVAAARKVGVIAIDPTSPLSGGSLLGDRIRMDEVAQDPNVFIRSMSSGSACDGLCPNISSLLAVFEQANFEYLIVETVGVGQVSYEARSLVDTFVLVLVPESGDTVQAMKAGILEVADIYVVNKADRPASAKLATELRSIAGWRGRNQRWVPPVILTSARDNGSASELAEAIEAHRHAVMNEERVRALVTARREYHLRSLIIQHVNEILATSRADIERTPIADSLRLVVDKLRNS